MNSLHLYNLVEDSSHMLLLVFQLDMMYMNLNLLVASCLLLLRLSCSFVDKLYFDMLQLGFLQHLCTQMVGCLCLLHLFYIQLGMHYRSYRTSHFLAVPKRNCCLHCFGLLDNHELMGRVLHLLHCLRLVGSLYHLYR